MPDFETHISKYRHNKNFSKSYISNESNQDEQFDDWKIIGMFYSAIHIIEAVLKKEYNIDSENHSNREESMQKYDDFSPEIRRYFKFIKSTANKYRYNVLNSVDSNEFCMVQDYLMAIEQEYKNIINT